MCRPTPALFDSDVSISAAFSSHISSCAPLFPLSSSSGRLLSTVFLTKPPRKVYPDYYQIIQRPIALDDIKKRLDINAYPSMQAVRADFELLFNNALEYNMKDSVIWKDAKDMLVCIQALYFEAECSLMFSLRNLYTRHTISSYPPQTAMMVQTRTMRRKANLKHTTSAG